MATSRTMELLTLFLGLNVSATAWAQDGWDPLPANLTGTPGLMSIPGTAPPAGYEATEPSPALDLAWAHERMAEAQALEGNADGLFRTWKALESSAGRGSPEAQQAHAAWLAQHDADLHEAIGAYRAVQDRLAGISEEGMADVAETVSELHGRFEVVEEQTVKISSLENAACWVDPGVCDPPDPELIALMDEITGMLTDLGPVEAGGVSGKAQQLMLRASLLELRAEIQLVRTRDAASWLAQEAVTSRDGDGHLRKMTDPMGKSAEASRRAATRPGDPYMPRR